MNSNCLIARLLIVFMLFHTLEADANIFKKRRREPLSLKNASAEVIAKLTSKIDGVLKGKKVQSGIAIASLDTGELLYTKDPDQLLIPASTAKLFTAFAALRRLQPTATFKTEIYSEGPLHEGELAGNIFIKGGGDPSLVSERMWMLTNELVRSGIKKISGNIIADSSFYDEEKNPDSRPKYLKDQAYNAPIGALSFNFNTTTIYARPGEKIGSPLIVYSDPENSYIDIVNQATTGKPGSANTVQVSRTDYVKGDIGDTVLLRGSLALDAKEIHFYKNIVNPSLYTAHMLRTFWEQRGLKVQGKVDEGKVPDGAKKILEFESLPLWQIIWGMNKFSNNFVADQILKKLGAELWGAPGTREKGIVAIQEVLEDIGIPKKSYTIVDGSGLTRNTKVTARQLLTVLTAAYKDFSVAPELIASLGIAGEDGTLRRRFPGSIVKSLLRAKTGSLDGVNSLAGYTPTADGELLAFVILLNDPKNHYGSMTGWIDQIATLLGKFSRK